MHCISIISPYSHAGNACILGTYLGLWLLPRSSTLPSGATGAGVSLSLPKMDAWEKHWKYGELGYHLDDGDDADGENGNGNDGDDESFLAGKPCWNGYKSKTFQGQVSSSAHQLTYCTIPWYLVWNKTITNYHICVACFFVGLQCEFWY